MPEIDPREITEENWLACVRLVVSPDQQALLARMKATNPHLRKIALDYHEQNTTAAQLYASLGFVTTGEQEGHDIISVFAI